MRAAAIALGTILGGMATAWAQGTNGQRVPPMTTDFVNFLIGVYANGSKCPSGQGVVNGASVAVCAAPGTAANPAGNAGHEQINLGGVFGAGAVYYEEAFAGATVTARVQAACSQALSDNPSTVSLIRVPSSESDTTPVAALFTGRSCIVEDDRGLIEPDYSQGYGGNSGNSLSGEILLFCAKTQAGTLADTGVTNPSCEEVYEEDRGGGFNNYNNPNQGIVSITFTGTGSGYTSGPATISGGTFTTAANYFCVATAGAITAMLPAEGLAGPGVYSSISGLSVSCPSGSGQTFTAHLAEGTKTNYIPLRSVEVSRSQGQHISFASNVTSYSPGDTIAFSTNVNCHEFSNAAGDQGCNPYSAVTRVGWAPLTGVVAAINGNVLTICGSSAISGGVCGVAPTNGQELGEGMNLVNTSRSPYSTGTISSVSGTPPTLTGSGTSWNSLSTSNPASNFPLNLYFEFPAEATQGGVTAATYTSGGTFSGTGTVNLSGFSGGCSGVLATMAVSSGTAGAITIQVRGNACTTGSGAQTLTASCSTGTISCSGTVTLSATVAAGTGAHQILQVTAVGGNTNITLANSSQGGNIPYGGVITGGAYAIYQGSQIVSAPYTGAQPCTTCYAAVGDPSQFQVGDSVMGGEGAQQMAEDMLNSHVQNVPVPNNYGSTNLFNTSTGSFPLTNGALWEGSYKNEVLSLDWADDNVAGVVPSEGIFMQGAAPTFGFINADDPARDNLECLWNPFTSTGSNSAACFDRTSANNWWVFGPKNTTASDLFVAPGQVGIGETPPATFALGVNGTLKATGLQLTGLLGITLLGTDSSGDLESSTTGTTGSGTMLFLVPPVGTNQTGADQFASTATNGGSSGGFSNGLNVLNFGTGKSTGIADANWGGTRWTDLYQDSGAAGWHFGIYSEGTELTGNGGYTAYWSLPKPTTTNQLIAQVGAAHTAQGSATLSSGTATVSSSAACTVSATCIYQLTDCGPSGTTLGAQYAVGTITAGTSFVINALSTANAVVTTDASKICWAIN
jgi:hypothetical protein